MHLNRHRREMTARYALRFATADLARARHCGPEDWEAPHRGVVAEIPAGELRVIDIESDPPEQLCDFIGVPRLRPAPFNPGSSAGTGRSVPPGGAGEAARSPRSF